MSTALVEKLHKGWIIALKEDESDLMSRGITLGEWDPEHLVFRGCFATNSQIQGLIKEKGRYFCRFQSELSYLTKTFLKM